MIPPDIGIPMTPQIERLITNRSFRRLTQINQLSMVSLIYPGAEYKRYVHVLRLSSSPPTCYPTLLLTPIFRLHVDREVVVLLLASVLAHDINHFPFLHISSKSHR